MKSETKLKLGLGAVLTLFVFAAAYVIYGMAKDLGARGVSHFMADPAAAYESDEAIGEALARYHSGAAPARLLAAPPSDAVILVFDGLPPKTDTQRLLSVLRAKHVKAFFFVEGENAAMEADLIRKIKRDGHTVGNFTFYGQGAAGKLPIEKFMKEAVWTQTALTDILGSAPQYMRAPGTPVSQELLLRVGAAGIPTYVDTPHLFLPGQMKTEAAVKTFAASVGGGTILAVVSGHPVVGGPRKPKIQTGKNGPIEHKPTVKDSAYTSPSEEVTMSEKVEILLQELSAKGLRIVGEEL
ncbi:MAG: polysaccharide deacetylase family protein [Acidaminococcus sp.]|jgi:peptidoglycan/xylan/chitin deacetylase (PgdA/CDA1 family)|nr:polysaccharide deacetylase family protein [Acidaminococcus sp.]MCI2115412.1 polysaccharide deacetylase family protein [Acidaminococcus sp.]